MIFRQDLFTWPRLIKLKTFLSGPPQRWISRQVPTGLPGDDSNFFFVCAEGAGHAELSPEASSVQGLQKGTPRPAKPQSM